MIGLPLGSDFEPHNSELTFVNRMQLNHKIHVIIDVVSAVFFVAYRVTEIQLLLDGVVEDCREIVEFQLSFVVVINEPLVIVHIYFCEFLFA
jgi:hypothetical protein